MSARQDASKKRKTLVPSNKRLETLYETNTRLWRLRNGNDLLERLIMDCDDGTDLRLVVDRIRAIVLNNIQMHQMYSTRIEQLDEARRGHAVATANFTNMRITDANRASIESMFAIALRDNANDDKARTAQLAILFFALTVNYEVRRALAPAPQHVDSAVVRAIDGGAAPRATQDSIERAVRREQEEATRRANQIALEPLTLFLKNDALRLLQRLLDRSINRRAYVENCAAAYLAYKPAITPLHVRQSKEGAVVQ